MRCESICSGGAIKISWNWQTLSKVFLTSIRPNQGKKTRRLSWHTYPYYNFQQSSVISPVMSSTQVPMVSLSLPLRSWHSAPKVSSLPPKAKARRGNKTKISCTLPTPKIDLNDAKKDEDVKREIINYFESTLKDQGKENAAWLTKEES